jgi:nucleoside-diphosphate-sugar epimerase
VHGATRGERGEDEAIRWVHADLIDIEATQAVFADIRPEIVIHLAARVAGARDVELVPEMLTANLLTTINVLMCALESGCGRVVLAGSVEEPVETSPEPSSPYAASKWAASGYARMFHALYGSPTVELRISMAYGPGQRDEQKLVPYTTLSLLRGEPPRLTSGSRGVDWIYIDDVVDAFVRASSVDGIDGEAIDVGSGSLVTIREVVERIAALIDTRIEPDFGAVPDRVHEISFAADLGAAKKLLGWEPATPLDTGLQRTVEWYAHRLGVVPRRRSA